MARTPGGQRHRTFWPTAYRTVLPVAARAPHVCMRGQPTARVCRRLAAPRHKKRGVLAQRPWRGPAAGPPLEHDEQGNFERAPGPACPRCGVGDPPRTSMDGSWRTCNGASKPPPCPPSCTSALRGSRQLARCCLANRFTFFIGRAGRHEPDKLTLLFLELLPACNSLTCRRAGRPKAWLRYAYTMD